MNVSYGRCVQDGFIHKDELINETGSEAIHYPDFEDSDVMDPLCQKFVRKASKVLREIVTCVLGVDFKQGMTSIIKEVHKPKLKAEFTLLICC